MKRSEKEAHIEELGGAFRGAPHAVVATFSGLTANQANDLRRRLARVGGRYAVLKNRLAKRAAVGTPIERLVDHFVGPCALVTHDSDPIVLAKTLTEFTKDNPKLELMAALVDAREIVDGKGLKQLATLPALPELRAQLLALVQTPATMLVRLIGTPGTQVARVLEARREQLEGKA